MIALLCSVEAEATLLKARAIVARSAVIGSKTIREGTIDGSDVLLCVSGMGKVNAAHGASILMARYDPEALIIFGIGGAYPASGAAVGDVVLANREIAGDEGVLTAEGFKGAEYMGIPLLKTAGSVIFNDYPAPEVLLKKALQVLRSSSGGVQAGPFVSVSSSTGTVARARELEARYRGLCENMEGAAAAQVAEFHQVPWLEVRAISNIVEDRDLSKWDIPRAADAVQRAVLRILGAWKQ